MSISEQLRAAADAVEGVEACSVTASPGSTRVHVGIDSFRSMWSGREVQAEQHGRNRHYSIEVDGIIWVAVEIEYYADASSVVAVTL